MFSKRSDLIDFVIVVCVFVLAWVAIAKGENQASAAEPFETSLLRTEGCVEEAGDGFCKVFGEKFEAWKKGLIASPNPEHRWLNIRVKPALRKEKKEVVLEMAFITTAKTSFLRLKLRKGTSCAQAAELAFGQFHYWLYGRLPLASDRAQIPP